MRPQRAAGGPATPLDELTVSPSTFAGAALEFRVHLQLVVDLGIFGTQKILDADLFSASAQLASWDTLSNPSADPWNERSRFRLGTVPVDRPPGRGRGGIQPGGDGLLVASWIVYLVYIVAGVWVLMALADTVDPVRDRAATRSPKMRAQRGSSTPTCAFRSPSSS